MRMTFLAGVRSALLMIAIILLLLLLLVVHKVKENAAPFVLIDCFQDLVHDTKEEIAQEGEASCSTIAPPPFYNANNEA